MAQHSGETGASLHFTKVNTASLAGAQPGTTPSFIGEERFDVDTGNRWVAKATSAATDWQLQKGPEYQAVIDTAGKGTHTTLAAAIADSNVLAGSRILVKNNQVLTSTVVVSKANLYIEFAPGVEVQDSTVVTGLSITADGVSIVGARFTGFGTGGDKAIDIDAAADYTTVTRCRFASTVDTEVNDGNGNSSVYGNFSE